MDTGPSPPISVVMPVHNGAPYLDAAIRSIFGQTWRDFEFLILDDGSTDDTTAILERWAARDERIRIARNLTQEGWGGSSDRVARMATAPVCARMDADDVAHPERLAREWAVLRDHPDVVLVGTLSEDIDREGRRVRPRDRWALLRRTAVPPFPHGTIMFRRAPFLEIGGYRQDSQAGEDVDLCRRMSRRGRVVVRVDALHQYRFHAGSATRELLADRGERGLDQIAAALDPPREAESDRHSARPAETSGIARRRALYYAAASTVWAGERPGVAPLRSLVGTGFPTLGALKISLLIAGALWSPAALRAVMGLTLRARDRLAGWLLGRRATVDWQPRRGS
jgi:glycosyltransferase involved in cell wall biosynthesis